MTMSMKKMQQQSYLHGNNAAFIEELYSRYLHDENSVDENWRNWFSELGNGELGNGELAPEQDHLEIQAQMKSAVMSKRRSTAAAGTVSSEHESKQVKVLQLINAYRVKGHQKARLDPLGLAEIPDLPEMTLVGNELGEADLDIVFNSGSLFGVEEAPLREIIRRL
jgi:2-oxoglutarate dehydrogenase E1 component